jgi:PAS domain S-box-containing protein
MVFGDRELRARRTNAAFRRLVGLPGEAILGRRPSEGETGMDTALTERTLAEQVMNRGVPVVGVHIEQTLAGERRVLSWSAYRVTHNGQVLGAVGLLLDVTDRVQAHARLDLLERAGSQIGTTLDIHRTAVELAVLAVPELADRIAIDLCDECCGAKISRAPAQSACGFAGARRRRTAARGRSVGSQKTWPISHRPGTAHSIDGSPRCITMAATTPGRRPSSSRNSPTRRGPSAASRRRGCGRSEQCGKVSGVDANDHYVR